MTRPPTELEAAGMWILGAVLAEWWCRWVLVRELRREIEAL